MAEENVKFEVGTVNTVHNVQPTTDPLAAQPQPTQQQTQQAVKTCKFYLILRSIIRIHKIFASVHHQATRVAS